MPSDNDSEKKDSKENYFATLRADYEQTHQQINQLADIRFKLLAFVPTVSTLATLLGTKAAPGSALVGGFLGFFAILGITMYELRNSQIYDSFIARAKKLERLMSSTREEQYGGLWSERPSRVVRLFGIPVWHDLALAIIYSTALGGWLYLIIYSFLSLGSSPSSTPPLSSFVIAASVAGIVTIAFFLEFLYIEQHRSDTGKKLIVNDVIDPLKVPLQPTPLRGDKYVSVNVCLRNVSKLKLAYNISELVLQDNQCKQYSYAPTSHQSFPEKGTLRPDQTEGGFIEYAIPEGNKPAKLIYTHRLRFLPLTRKQIIDLTQDNHAVNRGESEVRETS